MLLYNRYHADFRQGPDRDRQAWLLNNYTTARIKVCILIFCFEEKLDTACKNGVRIINLS